MSIPSIILPLLLEVFSTFCSDILFLQKDLEYYDGNKLIHLSEYTIRNNSQECVISWVDYQTSFGVICEEPIIKYFFYRKGDFSVANLLTEEAVLVKDPPTLGKNFLVRIKPGESFRYLVINKRNMKDHIFYYKESEIISVIGGPIINNELFYRGQIVVIE